VRQLETIGERALPAVPVLLYFREAGMKNLQPGFHPPPYATNPDAALVLQVLAAVAPSDAALAKDLPIILQQDANPHVRAAAAGLLVRVRPAGATAALMRRLDVEPNDGVRVAICDALGTIGPEAKAALKSLSVRSQSDTSEAVRAAAGRARDHIKDGP
jgi:hypothetical protein